MRRLAFLSVFMAFAGTAWAQDFDSAFLRGSVDPIYPVDAASAYPLEADAPPPAPSWTGFYVGVATSFGWGRFDTLTATTFTGAYFLKAAGVAAVNAAGVQAIDRFNVAPGVTAGYNWQSGGVVLGVETDLQSIGLSGGSLTGPVIYPGSSRASFAVGSAASANWLLTARSRIGWAQDDYLIYGTAGAAVTSLDAQFSFADRFGTFESGILGTTRLGLAVGGGVETAVWDHWSAKAEYLYVHFSPVSVTSTNLTVLPAIPVPGQPFTHSADLSASIVRLGLNYRFGEPTTAAVVAGIPVKAPPMALAWTWTGLYIGGHMGAAASTSTFADPFGTSVFGDTVRSPGFLVGGQLGYNWQAPGTRWVLGIEADASRMDSDGTATCFAASGLATNATCRVQPQETATLTGRVGYAFDPFGRSLIYGKAGAAWAKSNADMALGNDLAGFAGPDITSNSASLDFSGWTLGIGAEYAMTPAWSVKFEYDYLVFGSRALTNLGSATFDPNTGLLVSATPPGTSGVTQNIQTMKMGVNYKLASAGDFAATAPQVSGWQVEIGGRYFGGWGQFHKDVGQLTNSGLPSISNVSRLTYDDMQTNAGELFARADLPWWNLFVKGYVGTGLIKNGHMNDEDFGIPLFGFYAAYSNTLSPVVAGRPVYGAVDAGYDFVRTAGYRLGGFAGFFYFSEAMNAFGCTPLANFNCNLPVPVNNSPGITELDRWSALRVGLAGDGMIADRLKLGGEVAYLPYATFNGLDQHFFGNSGEVASNNPETGNAHGVQLEVLLSYYLSPHWSLGVGGRYWALWTTNAQVTRNFDNGSPIPPTSPQFFKGVTEQAGAFVQAAYCFGPESF